jgi:alpha-tubulin suppressor-like RCC1 family protein
MIASGENNSYGIRAGKLFAWGDNDVGQLGLGNRVKRSSPVQVGSLSDWKSIAGGQDWALAVR